MKMKRILVFFSVLFVACLAVLNVSAQPSWAKKASKAVFTLKTFAADGTLLGSATGFYVGEQGEAVAPYNAFRGASSAVVIDSEGKEWPVTCMLGANETYDVAKFRVEVKKKSAALTLSPTAVRQGDGVWLLPYREAKKARQGVVRKVESFNRDYHYYTIALAMPENTVGAPLLSEQGQVVAIMQPQQRTNDTLSYAVDAHFADSLRITGLSINDPALKAIGIKKALPAELSQALLTLYVAGQSLDSLPYVQLVDDFIVQFPTAPDGYQYRARMALSTADFATAKQYMEQAISVADNKADAHYAYSRLIMDKELYMPEKTFDPWSLDVAFDEARQAYELSAQPTYRHQQAQVLFAQKKYEEACQIDLELTQSSLRSPELFYEASRCRAMLGDSIGQMALLDSALSTFTKPYLREAAPYLLARAQVLLNHGRYRDAVLDMNDYETLMRSQLNANFYYLRHQADLGGRLFQQALNDINRAIELSPKEPLYLAEKASLLVRVGLYDDVKETARQLIALEPKQSDGYLFLGLGQCLTNEKAEGLKNLQKARDMGDPQAEGLIEKYSKK